MAESFYSVYLPYYITKLDAIKLPQAPSERQLPPPSPSVSRGQPGVIDAKESSKRPISPIKRNLEGVKRSPSPKPNASVSHRQPGGRATGGERGPPPNANASASHRKPGVTGAEESSKPPSRGGRFSPYSSTEASVSHRQPGVIELKNHQSSLLLLADEVDARRAFR